MGFRHDSALHLKIEENSHARKLASYDPSNGELVGEVVTTPVEAIDEVVARAREAARSWKKLGFDKRVDILLEGFAKLAPRAEEFATLLSREGDYFAIDSAAAFLRKGANVVSRCTQSTDDREIATLIREEAQRRRSTCRLGQDNGLVRDRVRGVRQGCVDILARQAIQTVIGIGHHPAVMLGDAQPIAHWPQRIHVT